MQAGVRVATSAVKYKPLMLILGVCRVTTTRSKLFYVIVRALPKKHAAFLAYLSDKNLDDVTNATDTQSAF